MDFTEYLNQQKIGKLIFAFYEAKRKITSPETRPSARKKAQAICDQFMKSSKPNNALKLLEESYRHECKKSEGKPITQRSAYLVTLAKTRLLREIGKMNEAEETLIDAIHSPNTHGALHAEMAKIYSLTNRIPEAIEILNDLRGFTDMEGFTDQEGYSIQDLLEECQIGLEQKKTLEHLQKLTAEDI